MYKNLTTVMAFDSPAAHWSLTSVIIIILTLTLILPKKIVKSKGCTEEFDCEFKVLIIYNEFGDFKKVLASL